MYHSSNTTEQLCLTLLKQSWWKNLLRETKEIAHKSVPINKKALSEVEFFIFINKSIHSKDEKKDSPSKPLRKNNRLIALSCNIMIQILPQDILMWTKLSRTLQCPMSNITFRVSMSKSFWYHTVFSNDKIKILLLCCFKKIHSICILFLLWNHYIYLIRTRNIPKIVAILMIVNIGSLIITEKKISNDQHSHANSGPTCY